MLFGASRGVRPRVLILALLVAPTLTVAQEQTADASRGRTHTVKRGDTLWDIARTYLNDPFQWPEIYRLNRAVVEDPHWIYPGELLTLPGGEAPTVAERSEPAEAPPVEAPVQEPISTSGVTAFTPVNRVTTVQSRVFSDAMVEEGPAVRPGEILAAPWAERRGGPAGPGRVLESAELRRGDRGGIYRGQMQLYEEVLIELPAGVSSARGSRVLAFEAAEIVREEGRTESRQMMYPLGVLEVIRTPAAGEAAVARVVRLFGAIRPGALLTPLDSAALRAGGEATINMGDAGPVTTVRWVWREQPMPSLQSYVLLDAGEGEGVHVGDRFTIFRPRTAEPNRPDSPALDIATAQVVRVTPLGSTAIIVGHKLPAVEAGMKARATARVP
jgi:hypothetical protein